MIYCNGLKVIKVVVAKIATTIIEREKHEDKR